MLDIAYVSDIMYIETNENHIKKGIDTMPKKTLTADDLFFLAKRGKVTDGFHTTRTDGADIDHVHNVVEAHLEEVNPLVGKMLHTSWGYNMTINDFARIISVSPSGKTVVCRRLTKEGFNGFTGPVTAGTTMIGQKFRLHIKDGFGGGSCYVGSYPHCIKDVNDDSMMKKSECSTRKGYWGEYNGSECFENHMD